MAVAAEALQDYGNSLRIVANLAPMAVQSVVERSELQGSRELGFADFKTAVTEMLKTDPEFRSKLDIERRHEHRIINNQIVDDEGTPMVEVLANGRKKAEAASQANEALKPQAVRDSIDEMNAARADKLPVGKTLWGISMDPKEALARHPDVYKKRFGYKEGLLYLQGYSKMDEGTLIAFSFSVDFSNENLWREVAAAHGMDIPEGISCDEWLRYAVELDASPDETFTMLRDIREDYYRRLGISEQRHSATEFVDNYEPSLRNFFEAYYPQLGAAVASGNNNEVLQGFAAALLGTDLAKMKPEVRQQLMRVANSTKFNDEMGRVMNSLFRYAAVEQLRQYLPDFLHAKTHNESITIKEWFRPIVWKIVSGAQQVHGFIAQNILRGMSAGRSYGGCPGNIQLSNDEAALLNPQEAFGGQGHRGTAEENCVEVQNGQTVNCPYCKKKVTAIVPDRKTIYCSNAGCEMAAPHLKKAKQAASSIFSKLLADPKQSLSPAA